MITAVYARKSTEQIGVADEQKSVTRQVEHARQYAERKGWTVDDTSVFVDDGISGAEFANRPGFLRLMNALKPRPPFQVLVMSEESRLGREAIETAYALKQLVQAGVRVFFYLEDRERTLDSPTDKIMLSLTAFADELEREKARQRTYDAMLRKAKAGHVTGGRVFGYDNERTNSHVERRINDGEAAVVRQIFERCAAGQGFRTIAHELNDAHVPAPRPQQQRPSGWAPSSVREVLHRDLYRGVIVWNKTRKRNLWGQQKPTSRLASEWIEIPAPDLRLISDALWQTVHERLDAAHRIYLRATNGQLWGRPLHGNEAKHLLTGLARCGSCGGNMVVRSRNHGKRRAFYYACSSFHHRGRAVCANSLEMRLPDADDAILTALEGDLLAEDVIEEAMARAIALAIGGDVDSDAQKRRLEAALEQVQGDLQRLTAAILAGGEATTLVQAIKERERQREALARDLLALERPRPVSADAKRLRDELRAKLAEWKAMLRAHVPQARQMIRKLVVGRIVFTADQQKRLYRFAIPGSLARFFNGLVHPQAVASPSGLEPYPRSDYRLLFPAA